MGKFFTSIPPSLSTWALEQSIFFTASAPLAGKHINISPKGLPSSTFSIFSPNSAAYIDATGSGSETISHLYENGRITIMFCSFGPVPRIMRFFCKGTVVEWDDPSFDDVLKRMGKKAVIGARAVILLDIYKVQTSCGYGVPLLATGGVHESASVGGEEKEPGFNDRDTMGHWAGNKIEKNELLAYQALNNSSSLDGLPGLKTARKDSGERFLIVGDLAAGLRRVRNQKEAFGSGVLAAVVIYLLVCLVRSLFV